MPSRDEGFHEGEEAVHRLLKIPPQQNPTAAGFPRARYGMRVMRAPLMAVGTLDGAGRPWTSIWGGERGFARPIADNVVAAKSPVDTANDPVFRALWDGAEPEGEDRVVRPGSGRDDGEGRAMAALAIDLESRDRVKMMGSVIAGAEAGGGEVQLAMAVTESIGNCPKYINKRVVEPVVMRPELVSQTLPVPKEAVELIARADVFFLSSTDGTRMDTNHRGGAAGFVRVVSNTKDGLELMYPEFSGNRLYQTLGNFKVSPLVSLAIPDFTTSDVLYLSGTTEILIGKEARDVLPRVNLAVKITVTAARFVRSGLPFRASDVDYSPYNPPVRHLISEHDSHIASSPQKQGVTASLVGREVLTPSINRYTFRLSREPDGKVLQWRAGQYLTLDFAPELSSGYSHMRDDDPQSLNDDHVRTFTISSPPDDTGEVQITVRRHGPVTAFLSRRNLRAPLDVPVLGIGGEEAFQMPRDPSTQPPAFVAAGVGITPLLAQAAGVLQAGVALRVLWTLRGEDLGLVLDSFSRVPGLAEATKLFITTGESTARDQLDCVRRHGVEVEMRRLGRGDVDVLRGGQRKFFLCTGPGLLKALEEWLEGEEVVWEDFGY